MSRRPVLVLAVVGTLALAGPGLAALSDVATASTGTFTAAVLAPAGATTAAAGCTLGLLVLGSKPFLDVTWTRSSDLVDATSTLVGQELQVLVSGVWRTATTTTEVTAGSTSARATGSDAGALQEQTAYSVRVVTRWGQWSAAGPTAGATTPRCGL